MFGNFVRKLRLKQNLSLREFCKMYKHDPGNWSKMERGVIPPPKNTEKLGEFAKQLGISNGSDDWYEFIDLASAASGIIPKDILNDKELVNKLPLFFRTIRSIQPDKKDLEKLAQVLRKNP